MVDNPQNMNNSPSPGGDGVQSSESERRAASAQTSQAAQQRINAAERRERPQGSPLVQSPGEVLPGEASADAINAAEQSRKDAAEREHSERYKDLPESTRSEMDAGKKALERGTVARPAPTNPVDATEHAAATGKSV
jgi:hypothetical protein